MMYCNWKILNVLAVLVWTADELSTANKRSMSKQHLDQLINEVSIWYITHGTQYILAVAALIAYFLLYSICLYWDLIRFIVVYMLLKFLVNWYLYLGVTAYFYWFWFVSLLYFVVVFLTHFLFLPIPLVVLVSIALYDTKRQINRSILFRLCKILVIMINNGSQKYCFCLLFGTNYHCGGN